MSFIIFSDNRTQRYLQSITLAIFIFSSSAYCYKILEQKFDDLPSFYWGAQLVFKQDQSPYVADNLKRIGQQEQRKIYPFLYPPVSLLLFSPMALSNNYFQIKFIFTGLNLIALWLLGLFFCRLYLSYKKTAGEAANWLYLIVIPLGLLVFTPLLRTIGIGQTNLFLLLLLMPLLLPLDSPRKETIAGICLGLAIIFKIYLALLFLPLLLTHRWRLLLSSGLCIAVLSACSLLVLPGALELWLEWFNYSQSYGGYGKQIPHMMTIPWNQSINGFFTRHFLGARAVGDAASLSWITYSLSMALLLSTLFVSRQLSRKHPQHLAISISLFLLLLLLIAPLTWHHHISLAVPAIILYITGFRQAYTLPIFGFYLCAVLFMSMPFLLQPLFPGDSSPMDIQNNHIPLLQNVFMSLPMLSVLLLLLSLYWQSLKNPTLTNT